ncbi:NADPH-dependent ferric siderophore reductase [Mucilaginibacter gracilis]|uniref:NADPH-dependent ferric siderophore reductase n=1 Tax=Mucilaginibacter gracilis TaxID=423350 RepID=A0A495IVG9_9SPHI|nr:siderophore-interacting protein [Mucilaginibacter gracilis]RKR80572.1 NADPH-dependent ferric siderophore reductase [Mucilaginibacter gracilis]
MDNISNELDNSQKRIYTIAQVSDITDVTPHLRRITFKGDQFKDAIGCSSGMHLKIFLPLLGQTKAELPKMINGRPSWENPATKPIVRTYTIRLIDQLKGELSIEFFLHGDEGCASTWASNVKIGDELGIGIKPGKPLPQVDWYLFAGDETAIPAIAAMLESLPESARGMALLEVGSAVDTFEIKTDSSVIIRWFGRNGEPAAESGLLLSAIKDVSFPDPDFGSRLVWIAGEYTPVQAIRAYVTQKMGLNRDELRAVVYWKAGLAEDEFQHISKPHK